jgi:hypothetical protein
VRLSIRRAAWSLLLLSAAGRLVAASLEAGVAKATITPDVNAGRVYMAGFGNNRVATGVHDDLWVRCLALGAGNDKLVLCGVDLIGFFYDDVLKVRARVKAARSDVAQVIVASSHDHEGPDTMGLWGASPLQSGIDPAYLGTLDDRVAATALQAVQSLAPARLVLGRDDHPLLALLQDDSRPPYVKDPHLFVMKFTSATGGAPIATLVNWSDHPETLDSKNTLITADYPHWLRDYVEQHGGGTALFFNGAIGGLLSTLGDQVALLDPDTGEVAKDATWRKAELFGDTIGELALRAVAAGSEAPVNSIVIRQKVIFAPIDNDGFRVGGALGVFRGRKGLWTGGRPDPAVEQRDLPQFGGKVPYATGHDLQTEVDYVQFRKGGTVLAEIATVPGEIYPELVNGGITRYPGADYPDAPFEPILREGMHSPHPMIFGLANDELGYIIPKCEWDSKPPWLQNRKSRWYGEVNSAGPEVAGAVTRTLRELMTGQ